MPPPLPVRLPRCARGWGTGLAARKSEREWGRTLTWLGQRSRQAAEAAVDPVSVILHLQSFFFILDIHCPLGEIGCGTLQYLSFWLNFMETAYS